MVVLRKALFRYTMLFMSCILLCACQALHSDSQEPQSTLVDYAGIWMTPCLSINDRSSSTVRLELDKGNYRSELFTYNAQDCHSTENRDYTEIESGTYTIAETVAVPSGVVAHGVSLFVESRLRNGVPDIISDDEIEGDYFHRNGNSLYRATGSRIGVAGIFVPEAIDFSTVYYLQEDP